MSRKIISQAQRYFMTGVSMITSHGSHGKNVMAAEWTMQISYEPMLIAVFIHDGSSTLKNIKETKEFGVNVAAEDQTTSVSIAGGYSRKEIDKLRIQDSFQLIKAKKIKSPLISGCIVNAECKLFTTKKIGDHTMIVGKAVSIQHDKTKRPLVYHRGRYYKIGPIIEPIRHKVEVDKKTFDLFYKQARGKFVLKCVGAVVKSGNNILISANPSRTAAHTIHFVEPKRGQNYTKVIDNHLRKAGIHLIITKEPVLKRLVLKNGNKIQRINFILFKGKIKNKAKVYSWMPIRKNSLLQALIR